MSFSKLVTALSIIFVCNLCQAAEPLRPTEDGTVKEVFNSERNRARYGMWRSSKIGGGGYLVNVVLNRAKPDTIYTYSDVGGIFRSDDNGRHWRMVHNTASPQTLDCVRGLLVDPDDPEKLIAAAGSEWTKPQGIYVSKDGGKSWTKTLDCMVYGNGSNRSAGVMFARSPDDKNTIFAAPGLDGVFVSRDGGESWTSLGMEKHFINDFKIDRTNADRLFLCASSKKALRRDGWTGGTRHQMQGGFYRTDDGGKTWNKISEEAPWEMLQSPVNPKRWYAIFNAQRIKYTDDYGATWTDDSDGLHVSEKKSRPSSNNTYRAIDAGPDFLVAGAGAGQFYIKKPIDSKWRPIKVQKKIQGPWYAKSVQGEWDHFGRACSSVVVDPQNPDHWFFTDWYSLYQTYDAGKHWTLTIDGIENTVIQVVAQTPGDPGKIHMGMADNGYFYSLDGGDSFKQGAKKPDNCKAIAVAPSEPETMYILSPKDHGWLANTLFASIDGGKHFERSPMENIPDVQDRRINSLCVDFQDSHKVYIGVSGKVGENDGGVWVSEDSGKSWKWDGLGLPSGNAFFQTSFWDSGNQLARNTNGSMVAYSTAGVYYRDNDQSEWQRSSIKHPESPCRFGQVISSPNESGVFYLAELYGGLHKSTDNGKSWKKIYNEGVHNIAIDFMHSNRIAAALDKCGGIVFSNNGGDDWMLLDKNIPQRNRFKMAFAGDRLVVGTPGNGVMYLPISREGVKPVRAKETPSAVGKNILKYGDCESGDKGWYKWSRKGKITITSEAKGLQSGKGIRISAKGADASGSVSLPVKHKGKIRIAGYAASSCEKDTIIAVQCFDKNNKQILWSNIAVIKKAHGSKQFGGSVTIPSKTYRTSLTVVLASEGDVLLDEITAKPMSSIY